MASKVRLVPIQDVNDLDQVTTDIQAVIDEEVAGAVELLYRVKIEVVQAEDRLNSNRAVITFIDQSATGIVIQDPSVRVFSVPNISQAAEIVNQVILQEEDPVSDKYIVGAPEFSVIGDELNRAAAVVILTFGVVSNSGGGGGIPGVRILDEGALVGTFVGMNFTGDVTATDQGGGDAQIDIQAGTDEQARVSAADTTSGYLGAKIVPEDAKLSFTTLNPAGNEQLQIGVAEANIDHDALANYVANEHIDHSTVSVGTAVDSGLTGGGDLTGTRTLSVDISGTTEETVPDNADLILFYDDSTGQLRSMSRANFLSGISAADELVKVSVDDTTSGYLEAKVATGNNRLSITTLNPAGNEQLELSVEESNIDHDALANYVANEHVDHSLVSIGTAAGSALTGGGDLTATRALSLDIDGLPELISVAAGDTVVVYDVSEGAFRKVQQSNFTGGVGTDEQVKVSASDTSAGYLGAKLVSGNNRLSVATLNPGAVEQFELLVEEANIDHDALANYVANEHIDHSLVSIGTAANSGLTGGGDLTAARSLSVDIAGTTAEATVDNADLVLIYDDSLSALRSMTRSNFLAGIGVADEQVKVSGSDTTTGFLGAKLVTGNNRLSIATLNPAGNEQLELSVEETNIDHDALANYVANEHIDHSLVSIGTAADSGLTGGGDLTVSRSLSVDIAGTTEEATADNADMVLIYDDSASELRSMSRSNFLAGVGGGGGIYVEAEVGETVISSTTFQPYHQETLTVTPGDYYLTWDVILTRDGGQVRLIAEITLDTVRTTPWSGADPFWFQPLGNNSSDVRAPYTLVGGIVTLGAGSHNFSLNLRAASASNSYTIHAAYMKLERKN